MTWAFYTANGEEKQAAVPPAGDVSFGGYKATLLGAPTGAQDAATKNYVDTKVMALPVVATLPTVGLVEGQVVNYQNAAMAAAGVVWAFCYRSAEATYKWEFIGGSPMNVRSARANTTPSNTAYAAGTPANGLTLTLPALAGDFDITINAYGGLAADNLAGACYSYTTGSSSQAQMDSWAAQAAFGNTSVWGMHTFRHTALPASTVLTERSRITAAGSYNVFDSSLSVIPVRVI